jgi:hypothetical protein
MFSPQQQQQQQQAQQQLMPAGPTVSLDTPYWRLSPEQRTFLDQLDTLIDATERFNSQLLQAHGADTHGALQRIGANARTLSGRVDHLRAELAVDEETVSRFKREVELFVTDARHADEAFEHRADFSQGAGDGGSTLAFSFFERKAKAMRRQGEELSAHLAVVESLLGAAEQPGQIASHVLGGHGGGGMHGRGLDMAAEVTDVFQVANLVREHQRLIESLTAHVAETHEQVSVRVGVSACVHACARG